MSISRVSKTNATEIGRAWSGISWASSWAGSWVLLSNLEIADYYDKVAVVIGYKPAYNWITVDLISTLNRAEKEFSSDVVPAEILLEIIANVQKI